MYYCNRRCLLYISMIFENVYIIDKMIRFFTGIRFLEYINVMGIFFGKKREMRGYRDIRINQLYELNLI